MQKSLCLLTCAAVSTLAIHSAQAQIAGALLPGGDVNLTSYTNAFDPAGGGVLFGSAGDGFGQFNVVTSPSIPFALVDDTIDDFAADTQGIVVDGPTATSQNFFGIVDTQNGDNDGDVVATYTFDVSSATVALDLGIDVAAMGDFESTDIYGVDVSIDGGGFTDLFDLTFLDTEFEEGSDDTIDTGLVGITYTLASGTEVFLDDPMTLDGTILTNVFQSFSFALGTATDTVAVQITANTDGGGEAVAFQNLTITEIPEPASLGLLSVAGLGLLRRRK